MPKNPFPARDHDHHHEHDTSTIGGRTLWFFEEFLPVMFWGAFFVLMIAIPLTLSGLFPNPFATATTVWPGYGLMVIVQYLLAIAVTLVAPAWLIAWILVLGIYELIVAEQSQAWFWGDSIAVLFLMYVIVGIFVYLISGLEEKKSRL